MRARPRAAVFDLDGMEVVGVLTSAGEAELAAAGAAWFSRDYAALPPALERLLFG